MQNLIFSLALLLLGSAAIAQDVYIPDVNLKNKLLNHDPIIDTNGDGEIQIAEAEAVTGMLYLYSWTSSTHITNLAGLEAFVNITGLNLSGNDINTPEFSLYNSTSLEELDISLNPISSVDLNLFPSLKKFIFTADYYSDGPLSFIDLSPLPDLEYLNLSSQELTEIDVSNLSSLETLIINYNPINELDVYANSALTDLATIGTLITELDLSSNFNLEYLEFHSMPNLSFINVKNGNSAAIYLGETMQNLPNFQVLCVDSIDIIENWESYQVQNLEDSGAVLTSYCSFSPAQSNIIEGELKLSTGNGCDAATALVLPNTMVKSINSENSAATFTDENGQFLVYTNEGLHTTFAQSSLPSYLSTTPGSHISDFTGYGNTDVVDFCMDFNQTINDLNVVVFQTSAARPGFPATYRIVYENMGSSFVDGEVVFEFDDTMQSFVSATPAESSSTSNSLSFQFTDLGPFQNAEIEIEMLTYEPPTVEAGDVLNFTASITPDSNDYTPNDNTSNLAQTVVNSYDPNDKQVLEGEEIGIAQADDYLHYMVRFQNTGTASAINVVVADTLSSQLNWDSMRMVSASHDYRVQITNDNFVEFIFEGIDLPHEAADEAGSNGYVVYKIKPVDGLQVGDVIDGLEAGIYFDFNPPIITNEADTEIVDPTASTEIFDFENSISIHPNPTNDILHISTGNGMEVKNVEVYSISGQKLLQQHSASTLDVSHLPQGMYFVKIYSAEGAEVVKKIIKS